MHLFVLLACLIASTFASSSCYYPDGSVASNYTACNVDASSSSASFCCGPGYACLNNTVCEHTGAADDGNTDDYLRGACTDQTWASSSCPKFCMTSYTSSASGMTHCSSNTTDTYCCAGDSDCDCGTGVETVNFAGEPVALTTIGVTATLAAEYVTTTATSGSATSTFVVAVVTGSSSSASPTATSTSAIDNISENSYHKATVRSTAIGAGVGVPLGVLALAAIAFLLYRYKRVKKQLDTLEQRGWPKSTTPSSFISDDPNDPTNRSSETTMAGSPRVYVTPEGLIRGYRMHGPPQRPPSAQYPYAYLGPGQELDGHAKHEIDSRELDMKPSELETVGTELRAELESPVGTELMSAYSPQTLWSPASLDAFHRGGTLNLGHGQGREKDGEVEVRRERDIGRERRERREQREWGAKVNKNSMGSLNATLGEMDEKIKMEYSRGWQM